MFHFPIRHLPIAAFVILLLSIKQNTFAQTATDPQDSLLLLQFHQEIQNDGWPAFWNTAQPVSKWEGVTLNTRGKVSHLSIDGNKLGLEKDHLPDAIGLLKGLDQLGFFGAYMLDLKTISPEIGELTQVKTMYLDWNDLESLPDEIGKLKNLTHLRLTYNELTSLPEAMGDMQSLAVLNVSHNHLTSLPQRFSELTNFVELDFSSNNLQAFPQSIVDIESMTTIKGNDNEMKGSIPDALWVRGKYEVIPRKLYLYVSGNELSGRVLSENTDEYVVGALDISNNYYTLKDIHPDYELLQLYMCNLTFMPQKKAGTFLQTITRAPGNYTEVKAENYTPLEGSKIQWYFYYQMNDRGRNEYKSYTTYPGLLLNENILARQGFYYCKITHPDLPEFEIETNVIRVIAQNEPPQFTSKGIKLRRGQTANLQAFVTVKDDFTYSNLIDWDIPAETEHFNISSYVIAAKDPTWLGKDSITITVMDEMGASSTEKIPITMVSETNSPPTVQIPTMYLTFFDPASCDPTEPDCKQLYLWTGNIYLDGFVSDDIDDAEYLNYEIKELDPLTGTISPYFYASIQTNAAEDYSYRYYLSATIIASKDTTATLTLKVTDKDGGVTEQQVVLICKVDNQPPQFSDIPEQQTTVGNSFPPLDLKQYVTDDYTPIEDFTFKGYPLTKGKIKIDNGIAYFEPLYPDSAYTFTIVYEIYESDLYSYVQKEVTYTILDRNPVVSGKFTDGNGKPIEGVILNGFEEPVVSDVHGSFSIEVEKNWSATLSVTKTNYTFFPAQIEVGPLRADTLLNFIGTQTNHHLISGTIKDKDSTPLENVKLNGFPITVFTDLEGKFTAEVPSDWSGTITAEKENYSFTPATIEFTEVSSNVTDQDFTATYTGKYVFSGTIYDAANQPLAGVELEGFPDQVITKENGQFSITLSAGWSGEIGAEKEDYAFSPTHIQVSDLDKDLSNQNFLATYTGNYSISGTIQDQLNQPLSGVNIAGLPMTLTTNTEGKYSVDVPAGWSGSIKPQKASYTFSPDSLEIKNIQENVSEQNFKAILIENKSYVISGMIKDVQEKPLSGIKLTGFPQEVITDKNGSYSAAVPSSWSSNIKPVLDSYTFAPSAIHYTEVDENFSDQNYVAEYIGTYLISGIITSSKNEPVSEVLIDGLPEKIYTDDAGNFSALATAGQNITLTPSKEGYNFEPEFLKIENIQTERSNLNFNAEIQEEETPEVRVFKCYPNPTHGEVNIVLAAPMKSVGKIVVTDLNGKIISKKELPVGSQFLQWSGAGQTGLRLHTGIYKIQIFEKNDLVTSTSVVVIK